MTKKITVAEALDIATAAEMFDRAAELLDLLQVKSLDCQQNWDYENDKVVPFTQWQVIPYTATSLFDRAVRVEWRINYLGDSYNAMIEFRYLAPSYIKYSDKDSLELDRFNLPTWFNRHYPLKKALKILCLAVDKPDDTSAYDGYTTDNSIYNSIYNGNNTIINFEDITAPKDSENPDNLNKVFEKIGCKKANWFTLQALLNRCENGQFPEDPSFAVMPGRIKDKPALFFNNYLETSWIYLTEFVNSPYKYQYHKRKGIYNLQPTLKGILNPQFD